MQDTQKKYAFAIDKLKKAGLRLTRQRLGLIKVLFENGNKHFTAETLHKEIRQSKIVTSLATIYNFLNQFKELGLIKEVIVDSQKAWYDTNVTHHHHFFFKQQNRLEDITEDLIELKRLPPIPNSKKISHVEIVIHVND